MGFLTRVGVGLQLRAGEPRGNVSLTTDRQLLQALSSSGRMVTQQNVTGIAAVWAAVWLIADQGGSLPLRVYGNRDNKLVPNTTAWQNRLLRQPNPETAAVLFFSTLLAHLELWGNAYIGKEKVLGRVVKLWLIQPERVTVRRERGVKKFDVVEDNGAFITYTAADVIHVAGRSLDGTVGASAIAVHRHTLGVSLALDDFAGDTMRNRAVPVGILRVKGRITDPQIKDDMREEWYDRIGRKGKRNGLAILDEDATFDAISMPLVDAQFIEQREYSVQDVARIFGVPAELIGGKAGGSMSYSNLSQRNEDLLQLVLWSRLKRVEGALYGDADLFPNAGGLEPHFDDTDFVRGDPRAQFETLKIATGGKPILTQDEARSRVGAEPLGGKAAELDSKAAPDPNAGNGQNIQEDPQA